MTVLDRMGAINVDERRAFRPVEAARLLGVDPGTVYDAIRRGELPAVRMGSMWLIPRAAIEAVLK